MSRVELIETPLIRDMRETARDLGIVQLLVAHQRIVLDDPSAAHDLIDEALMLLGITVTNEPRPKATP